MLINMDVKIAYNVLHLSILLFMYNYILFYINELERERVIFNLTRKMINNKVQLCYSETHIGRDRTDYM